MNKDSHLIFEAYTLRGLAAGKSLEEIAKKHNCSVEEVKKNIEIGSKVEHEHTGNDAAAKKIATDHIFEDLKYYEKLKKIETKSEDAESYGMPSNEFKNLKLKKSELQIKKPSKELPITHPVIRDLAKQKYHELHSSEEAEGRPLTPYQQKIKDNDLKRKKNNEYNWINSFHRTFGPGYKEELEKAGLDPYAMYVDYYGGWHNENVVRKFTDIYNNKYPDYSVDVEKLLSLMQQGKEKPREGFKSEQEERRIDPKCWKGYHKQGTKLKNGVRVNNCVKNS